MTALLTQCPHCQTSFRVTTAQLNAANALVRCGSCLGVFSATANEIRIKHPDGYVVEEIQTADDADHPSAIVTTGTVATAFTADDEPVVHEPEPVPLDDPAVDDPPAFDDNPPLEAATPPPEDIEPAVGDPGFDELIEPEPEPESIAIPASKRHVHSSLSTLDFDDALEPVSGEELDALDDEPVTLDNSNRIRASVTTALLLATNVLLLLALPLPWLYSHRNELATHPRFGFTAAGVCRIVTCEVPPASVSTTAMYTQQLLVRSDPKADNALEVSFVFHNEAARAQPFPGLELAFSDANNTLLANRLFTPQEYLPPELRQLDSMPAQTSVQVQLEVADPGSDAVNYKVVLHAL